MTPEGERIMPLGESLGGGRSWRVNERLFTPFVLSFAAQLFAQLD
jgi:hypothetical protein